MDTTHNQLIQKIPNILIFDPHGQMGELLVGELGESLVPLFVTPHAYEKKEGTQILYSASKIPIIPNYQYQAMIVFYDGEKHTTDILFSFVNKAKIDKIPLYVVIPHEICQEEFVYKLIDTYDKVYCIVSGDGFSASGASGNLTRVEELVYQVKQHNKIQLDNTGLNKIYPVERGEIIRGILDIMSLSQKKTHIFLLLQKHPPTELHVVHVLQKENPLLSVDFSTHAHNQSHSIPPGEYFLEDDSNWKKKIVKALYAISLHHKEKQERQGSFTKRPKNSNRYLYALFFVTILGIIVLPVGVMLGFSLLGVYELRNAKQAVEKGDLYDASIASEHASFHFNSAQQAAEIVYSQLEFLGRKQDGITVTKSIAIGEDIAQVLKDVSMGGNTVIQVLSGRVKDEKMLVNGLTQIKSGITRYQQVRVEGGVNTIGPIRELIVLKDMPELDTLITMTSGVIDQIPKILDPQGKKVYLVLFQNNMELRPGGGFIGSYGLLTLDKGRFADFTIHDVYDADGQLKGHIEPPFPLRRYLPSAHWYLRDSNFNVDYSKNASMSAFFLQEETGQVVDGVIGVDVTFLKKLILATGPITIPEYNETVTADSLYMVVQKHVEKDFFPGSRQKKDFLRILFSAINQKIITEKKVSYRLLLQALEESITEKHLLFAFADQSIQSAFTANKLSSSLVDLRVSNETTLNDFLGISEANIGVNKANLYVKRKISYEAEIDKSGGVFSKATIMYNNTSGEWPGGEYKNYLRIIVPGGSILSSIIIDNQEQKINDAVTNPTLYEKKGFLPPEGLEVERIEQDGKTIYGFLVTVPVKKIKTIVVSYTLPQRVSFNESTLTYDLQLFKQPGTQNDMFSASVLYPDTFSVLKSSEDMVDKKDSVVYTHELAQDKNLQVTFTKK